ncbi:MAG: M43 family zinc metalloprotease, partial [Flavobacterium sp.]
KSATKTSWGTNDAMKKTAQGGLAPTSPTTKLNLWSCAIGGGILGYAQFPGGASSTDGVVIDSKYFGLSGSANAPFNLGRTGTHEVGHWMNLRHIWGDATCGSDLVSDTPTHNEENYGVPAYPHYSTCSGTPVEMTMNYMDYTDDNAMYMFSTGQKNRMAAIFVTGGPRAAFGI